MPTALALAPVILAAVLIFSGLAKRSDTGSTHSMMRLLRLPAFVANLQVARVLPWAEIGIAALLLTPFRWTYAVGAAAALVLFVAFLVIVARAMTFDPRPTCGCFGRVGDHRINARTVTRNVVLVALALVSGWIAVRGGSGTALLADFTSNDWLWLLLAVALAAVTWFILGAPSTGPSRGSRRAQREADEAGARRAAEAGSEPDELDYVRTPIPRGVLVGPDNETSSLQALARQQAQLVVLANCWCGTTVATIDRLPEWRERLPQLGVQLVHTYRPFDEPRLAGAKDTWWDPGGHVYEALRSGASPAAVLLGADGLLAGGPVNGEDEIAAFVDDIAAELGEAEAAGVEPDESEPAEQEQAEQEQAEQEQAESEPAESEQAEQERAQSEA